MNDNQRSYNVVVRTHGGLGNQIFQILYARLLAHGREPKLIHDANYPHAFGLSTAFAGHPQPGSITRLISGYASRSYLIGRDYLRVAPSELVVLFMPMPIFKARTSIALLALMRLPAKSTASVASCRFILT